MFCAPLLNLVICEGLSHSTKSVRIRSYFWSVFSCIWIEYEEILRISPYSVGMRQNVNQSNSKYGHFLRSDWLIYAIPTPHISFRVVVFFDCFALFRHYFKTMFSLVARDFTKFIYP